MRIAGALRSLDDEPSFTAEETQQLAESIMESAILETFREKHEVDFAYSLHGVGRFRVNAYYQRGSVALAMRRVRSGATSVSGGRTPPAENPAELVMILNEEPGG